MAHKTGAKRLGPSSARFAVAWIATAYLILVLSPFPALAQNEFSAADIEYFETKIRPILVDRCHECHSGTQPEANLHLTSREALIRGGDTGPAITPTRPDDSLLVQAINYDGPYEMPPDSKLPQAEIDLLTEWVRRGAPWPENHNNANPQTASEFDLESRRAAHWCWQPIAKPEVPTVRRWEWPRDDIDCFVLSKIENAGLHPAQEADRRTLLRRIYLDLIGLPPPPEQIQAFVDDKSADALPAVVDRLLASPQFGERWARHWMDLVRYAETYGHEFDYPISDAFEYRDYLIRAFNADVPYDQLVKEHLAGDLLTEPRRHPTELFNESLIGTGFWFFGEATHAPVDVTADEAGRIDNQIDVMSKTFLGLTISCARCHDHKFDAISTEDYYALCGFLQSSHQQRGMLDPGGKILETARQVAKKRDSANRLFQIAIEQVSAADPNPLADVFHHAIEFLRAHPKPPPPNTPPDQAIEKQVIPESHDWESQRERWADKNGIPLAIFRNVTDSISAAADWSDPFFAMRYWLDRPRESDPDSAANLRREIAARADARRLFEDSTVLFEDFSDGLARWYPTGGAFAAVDNVGGVSCAIVNDRHELVTAGVATSRQLGDKFRGVLRSPTFEITHRQIHYRYRGHDAKLRVIIDGYYMDVHNPLLFEGATFTPPPTSRFDWVTQAGDLKNHIGHRAHIEVVDSGDGYIDLDEIRMSDDKTPPVNVHPFCLEFANGETVDSETACQSLARFVLGQFASARDGGPFDPQIVQWFFQNEAAHLYEDALQQSVVQASQSPLSQSAYLESVSVSDVSIDQQLRDELSQWRELVRSVPDPRYCLAITDGSAENSRLFIRGNHKTLGPAVTRRGISAIRLPQMTAYEDLPGSGRLELAEEIASAENPLTSRVIVNRLWHHLFGRGIVASVDNFGVLGELPSHPELLDYLAAEFVKDNWSLKRMIRRLVLSRTYRMSSHPDSQSFAADPTNRLFHFHAVRRLDGESIRDSILAISGDLDLSMYGPSVPVHLTSFMQGRGRPGASGPLDGNRRRSIYLEVRRNFLNPMMLAFDTPAPFSSMGRRNVSNVPAQALILMNDPFVQEQAERWARRIVAAGENAEARITCAFLTAIGREPTPDELEKCLAFVGASPTAAATASSVATSELEPWTALCHVLINNKELIFVH